MNSVHFVSDVIFEGDYMPPSPREGDHEVVEGVSIENSPSITTASCHLPLRGRLLTPARNFFSLTT